MIFIIFISLTISTVFHQCWYLIFFSFPSCPCLLLCCWVNCSLWRASNDTFFDSERIELIDDPYHHQIVAAVKNRRIFQGKVKSPRVLDEGIKHFGRVPYSFEYFDVPGGPWMRMRSLLLCPWECPMSKPINAANWRVCSVTYLSLVQSNHCSWCTLYFYGIHGLSRRYRARQSFL